MYCRLRRGGGCDSRSDGSGELSGRRHTMQKIAYAASNRLPTLLKEEPKFSSAAARPCHLDNTRQTNQRYALTASLSQIASSRQKAFQTDCEDEQDTNAPPESNSLKPDVLCKVRSLPALLQLHSQFVPSFASAPPLIAQGVKYPSSSATLLEDLLRLRTAIVTRIVFTQRIRPIEFCKDNRPSMIKDLCVRQTF